MCEFNYRNFFEDVQIDEIQSIKNELIESKFDVTDELINAVKNLHFGEEKLSASQIGLRLGISDYIAGKIVRSLGGYIRTQKKITPDIENQILNLHFKDRKNAFQISKILNLSHASVLRIIKNHGGAVEPHSITTPELIAKVNQMHADGKNAFQIAHALNVSHAVITRIFRKLGFVVRKTITPEFLERVKNLYSSGKSRQQIAHELNTTSTTVTVALHKLGITNLPPVKKKLAPYLTPEQIAHIQSLLNQRKNDQEIANIYNVHLNTIASIIKKFNLKRRSKRKKPVGMSDEDYEIYLNTPFSSDSELMAYIYSYRKNRHQCTSCGTNLDQNKDGSWPTVCAKCQPKQRDRYRVNKQKIINFKGGKCKNCEYNKAYGLDLHHRDPKLKDEKWTKIRTYPLEKLKDELEKCDILCKNCHGMIHIKDVVKSDIYRKRKSACLTYKGGSVCKKCQTQKPNGILQFHHRDPSSKDKKFGKFLSWPEWMNPDDWRVQWEQNQKLPEKIQQELDKCDVLCGNCHADEHYDLKTGDTTPEYEDECLDGDVCDLHKHKE